MKFPRPRLNFWALFSGRPWLFRSWRRFGLMMLLLLFCPALLLFIYANRTLAHRLERQAFNQLGVLASIFARHLEEEFTGFSIYVESFASRRALVQAAAHRDASAVGKQLAALVQNNKEAKRAVFIDPKGVLVAAYPPGDPMLGRTFSRQQWFRGVAARGGAYVSGAFSPAAGEGGSALMFAAPIWSAPGVLEGYLGAQQLVSDLSGWIERVMSDAPIQVIIADQHGRPVAGPPALLEVLAGSVSDLKRDPAAFEIHYGEAEFFASRRSLPELGWSLYTVIPKEAALRPVHQTRRVVLAFFLLFSALLAAASLVWMKTLYSYAQGLQRSSQHLEYFCYNIAHNLRAPLRAATGFADLLRESAEPKLDGEERDYLRRIGSAGVAMDELIGDLLLFGKISISEVSAEKIDLGSLLDSVLSEVRGGLDRASAEVQVESPLGQVYGDRKLLHLALYELLCNAARFTVPGRKPAIRVHSEARGIFVRVWVHDNGRGIDPKYHDQIFELFSKLDPQGPGTGVGLALARNAVERMGGGIGIESKPAEGSAFWIQLPRA